MPDDMERDEKDAFKAYCIERSRDPNELRCPRQRALMACLVISASIQKRMVEAGALETLLDSIEATIIAAEKHAAADAIQSLTRQDEKMRAMMKERFEAIMGAVQDQDYGAVFVIAKIGASMLAAAPAPTKGE
jgi:hypothetical protein